jgi:hypothetical protein
MKVELYPYEVDVLILVDSNIKFFGDHTKEQEKKSGFKEHNYL